MSIFHPFDVDMVKNTRPLMPTVFREHERAVLITTMFNSGVLPIEDTHHDMRKALAQLPPDEARKIKRKFRKVWRRLAKADVKHRALGPLKTRSEREDNLMTAVYGAKKNNPSRRERIERKKLVQKHFYVNLVRPYLDQFEASGRIPDQKPNDSD